ncbi:hypothetical protein [Streptomyces lunaelactis]|uniref:hypothetical protein n=1 Tax=Streptomyces lunaelactis TaxID=1535768 RepID=UPI00131F1488|nr:hypothetical protein [Streptomyces lunaelactis]NUK86967.1 hypothetical protein [Streptomyces lunaelactis]
MAAAFVGLAMLVDEARKDLIEPSVYNSVKAGDAEAEVRDKLPDGDSFFTEGLDDKGSGKPTGAECLSLMSTEDMDDQGRDHVFRFCFKDGKLIEKRSYWIVT